MSNLIARCASTAILQEISRCHTLALPLSLATELVPCQAAGKRPQLAWMWMVGERVCTELEK
jgi:hypothetical protein